MDRRDDRGLLETGPSPRLAPLVRRLAVVVLLASPLTWSKAAHTTELVMFESATCEWCEAWDREIGFFYHKTEEGRRAPLRRVDIHDPRPAELRDVRGIVYTPTFILMESGRELGRITGYPGEDHFWGLLGALVQRLPTPTAQSDTCGGENATKGETSPC